MAERASGSTDPGPAVFDGDAPWLPDRVKKVLEMATDFASFKRARAFRFLHLFASKNDVLGRTLQGEATKVGINTEIRAVDWLGDKQDNLLADQPYLTLLERQRLATGMLGMLALLVEPFPPPGGMPVGPDLPLFEAKPKFMACQPTAVFYNDKLIKALCLRQEVARWLPPCWSRAEPGKCPRRDPLKTLQGRRVDQMVRCGCFPEVEAFLKETNSVEASKAPAE